MQLVRNPKQFDVLVTHNLFGDVLSDEAAPHQPVADWLRYNFWPPSAPGRLAPNVRFSPKRTFSPGRPNVRFAPIADIRPYNNVGWRFWPWGRLGMGGSLTR